MLKIDKNSEPVVATNLNVLFVRAKYLNNFSGLIQGGLTPVRATQVVLCSVKTVVQLITWKVSLVLELVVRCHKDQECMQECLSLGIGSTQQWQVMQVCIKCLRLKDVAKCIYCVLLLI